MEIVLVDLQDKHKEATTVLQILVLVVEVQLEQVLDIMVDLVE